MEVAIRSEGTQYSAGAHALLRSKLKLLHRFSPISSAMPSDELDRDKIYTAASDDWDSDAELELEPPDPEVIAAEERRTAAAVDTHRKSIDVEEVYRDFEANRDSEVLAEWVERLRNFRWQFQVRHLLVLTAVVALLLAIRQWMNWGTILIVGIMLAVAGVSLVLKLEENKRQEEADRRRRKMYAERRARQNTQNAPPVSMHDEEEDEPEPVRNPAAPAAAERSFHFQFSLSQLLAVTTIAAVLLGLGGAIGGMPGLATLCGVLALAGLLIPVLGISPPAVAVFAWWVVLALYVVLSLSAALWVALGGG